MHNLSPSQILTEGARCLGIELSQDHLAGFSTYLEELARWSTIANLVSQSIPESIIRKHILDSLAVSLLIPPTAHLLDLGSGAGFPGLVLAILRPSRKVVLLESQRKRANFLKQVARATKSANVKVFEGRAETLAKEESLQGAFSIVISRATWSLQDFLRIASPFVAPEGTVIALKGPQGTQELLNLPASFIDFELKKKHEYTLPFGKERRQALVFAKSCFT
jgi:16S rRNA (guanine527-N7)-methyltransferase